MLISQSPPVVLPATASHTHMTFTSPWFLEAEASLLATAAHLSSPPLQEVDWEVELAVVIGKKGKHIKVR